MSDDIRLGVIVPSIMDLRRKSGEFPVSKKELG